MHNSLLFVDSVSKSFEGKKILDNISIKLEKSETVSVLGISGSGKTTLFNIISGILSPDEGGVFLDEKNITSSPGHISYMLQKDLLFEHKKIIDNVSLPLVLRGVSKKEARKKALSLFEIFGLEDTAFNYPNTLSGGMRQRAAFLRTYLSQGKVTLLDEPFSALDTITKSKVYSWFLEMKNKLSLSTLLITHDIDEAILLSDKICILSGNPARISSEIIIDVSYDKRRDFELSAEFIEYKKIISDKLEIQGLS